MARNVTHWVAVRQTNIDAYLTFFVCSRNRTGYAFDKGVRHEKTANGAAAHQDAGRVVEAVD